MPLLPAEPIPTTSRISSADASSEVPLSSVHLDAIRGAAALIVFLGHTRDLYFPSFFAREEETLAATTTVDPALRASWPVKEKITLGNESVMIFFVLSGYLVGGGVIKTLRRNRWSWRDYLMKRLTRLWVVLIPALLLGVTLDFIGLHVFANPGSIYTAPPQQMVVHNVASQLTAPVILANALFLQNVLVLPAGSNDSLWSLANEFWYYMAFPLLLLLLMKKQTLARRSTYAVLFLSIALLVGRTIGLLFFIWVLGALLSVVPLMIPRRIAGILSFPVALLLPLVFVAVRSTALPIYLAQWIVALFSAFAIYVFLHQTERARNGIYRSMAGFLSRISYTLYLVHLPLAVLLCAWINNPWHRWSAAPKDLALFLLVNAGILFFTYLFYLAFEANTEKVRCALTRRWANEDHVPKSAAPPRIPGLTSS